MYLLHLFPGLLALAVAQIIARGLHGAALLALRGEGSLHHLAAGVLDRTCIRLLTHVSTSFFRIGIFSLFPCENHNVGRGLAPAESAPSGAPPVIAACCAAMAAC